MKPSYFQAPRAKLPSHADYRLLEIFELTPAVLGIESFSPESASELLSRDDDEDELETCSNRRAFIQSRWEVFDRAETALDAIALADVPTNAFSAFFRKRLLASKGRRHTAIGIFQRRIEQTFVVQDAQPRYADLAEFGLTRSALHDHHVLLVELSAPDDAGLEVATLNITEEKLEPIARTAVRQLLLLEAGTVRFSEHETVEICYDDSRVGEPYIQKPYDLPEEYHSMRYLRELNRNSTGVDSIFCEGAFSDPVTAVFQVEQQPRQVRDAAGNEAMLWTVSAVVLFSMPPRPVSTSWLSRLFGHAPDQSMAPTLGKAPQK